MHTPNSNAPQNTSNIGGIRTGSLFFLATAVLLAMTAAMNSALVLPLGAFLVMAVTTAFLGRQIYKDLALASERPYGTDRP